MKRKINKQKSYNDSDGVFENKIAISINEEYGRNGDTSTKNENKYDGNIDYDNIDLSNMSKNTIDLHNDNSDNTKNKTLLNFIEDRLTPHVVSVNKLFRKPRKSFLNFDRSTLQERMHFSREQSREGDNASDDNDNSKIGRAHV